MVSFVSSSVLYNPIHRRYKSPFSIMPPYRSRMYKYFKKDIDSLYDGIIFKTCKVSLTQLTAEDISNYKLSLIKKKDNTLKEDGNIYRGNDTSKIDVRSSFCKKSNDVKTSTDVRTSKDVKTAKENTSIEGEPAKKKQKVDTNGIDVLKLVLPIEAETKKCKSQLKPSLKPIKEIDSTEEVSMEIGCEKSTKSKNASAKNIKSSIWVKDINKMMNADQCIRWLKMINYVQKPNHPVNGMKGVAAAKLSTSGPKVNGVKHALKDNKINREYLIKIEKLYKKYFCKSVNDTIVVIANIINIIEMSNQYHKELIIKSLNNGTEAEQLKIRYDASRLNERHKIILEKKLKKNVKDVVSSFEESEFDLAFQMFFLSILCVHQVLKPKFKKGSIFRHLVLLLKDSMENSKYPQMFSLFNSKTFRPNCIDLKTQIEDSRVIDPGVINRMPLFFEPPKNSLEYFQAVIKSVTTDSKEDLAILFDNAVSQCSINSIFKDPVDTSTVTEIIQSPVNSNKINQLWFLAKNPNGTYQKTAVVNVNKSEAIGNTEVKPLIVTNQPSNQSLSSKNKCFVATSTNSHGPLVQKTAPLLETTTLMPTATTFVASQPPIQDKKSVANSRLRRAKVRNNKLSVKQYQLGKVSTGQMKAEVNGNNSQPEPTVLNNTAVELKPVLFLKCHTRNCINSAVFLCSKCQAVQYCSNQCREHDFFDCHQTNCEQLQNMRKT